jgi:hypothetical protein
MPKAMEDALKREGRKKGYKGERLDNFVYGIMSNRGWRKGQSDRSGHKKSYKD